MRKVYILFQCSDGRGRRLVDAATGETTEQILQPLCVECADISTLPAEAWLKGIAPPSYNRFKAHVIVLEQPDSQTVLAEIDAFEVDRPSLRAFYNRNGYSLRQNDISIFELLMAAGDIVAGSPPAWDYIRRLASDFLEAVRPAEPVHVPAGEVSLTWEGELSDLMLDVFRTHPKIKPREEG